MVAVMDVKLPDRTAARLVAEGKIQQQFRPHDIRNAIPLVDYTNPAKFPPYEFREYPKMPLLDGNRPIVIDAAGGVLVFYDPADEVEFKQMNPDIADEIERNAPAKSVADRIAAQDEEITELRARLLAAGISTDKPKPTNRLANVTKASVPPVRQADPEASEGLRETVAAAQADAPAAPPSNKPRSGGNPLKNKNKGN